MFKVEVNYVEIAATVVDDGGRFVPGLEAEDFELYENGERQDIATFSFLDFPKAEESISSLTSGVPSESDVSTNAGASEARVFVLLLDDLHVAAKRMARVRDGAAARRTVRFHVE